MSVVFVRSVIQTSVGSKVVGEMPEGCKLCVKGVKLVLFVTGLCARRCYYCPLSSHKRGRDLVYADEVKVLSEQEVLEEAELIKAKGTGLTGGDPLLRLERALSYIKLLKKHFGRFHHIHLYTTTEAHVTERAIKLLADAGLDEIRFHPNVEGDACKQVKWAFDHGLSVGVEVPAIPGYERKILEILRKADRLGATFANVNELEINYENNLAMRLRGFKLKPGSLSGALGSEEAAMRILSEAARATSLSVHYCPAFIKDRYQFRRRLLRKAKSLKKPYETITREGLLKKLVIIPPLNARLDDIAATVRNRLNLPSSLVYVNRDEHRVELPLKLAGRISYALSGLGVEAGVVEEYPGRGRRLKVSYRRLT